MPSVSTKDDLQGYGAVVIVEDFERIISESEEARLLFMGKPYYICFQLCLIAAALPAKAHNEGRPKEDHVRVKPIFDSHKEYSAMAKELFDKFIEKNPRTADILLPPDYEDDIAVSALQVADTFAYEIRKKLTRKIQTGDNYTRPPLERIRPFTYRVYKLDYDILKVIVAKQRPDYIAIRPVRWGELW